MSLKRLIVLAAIGLLSLAANAAQIIIPAAGVGPGANNSRWQSDLLLHNAAPRAIDLTMTFHMGTDVIGPKPLKLQAKNTLQMQDIVKAVFGVDSGTGAIVLELAERDVKYLAATSRTYNHSNDEEYGQDIPAIQDVNAATAGQIAVLTNPNSTSSALFRFNFGVYAIEETNVRWELLRADGTVAAAKEQTYAAGEHAQHNNGVVGDLLHTSPNPGDSLYARILSGKAVVYGSSINNTGDPTFVPSTITREDVLINLGIDIDENGTLDLIDEDGDGVLDAPLIVYTSLYPVYVHVVAENEFGEAVKLEVVQSEADAQFREDGTLVVGAAGDLKNKTGSIVLRATSDDTVTLFTIPVRFK